VSTFWDRLSKGLARTRERLWTPLEGTSSQVNEDTLDTLEAVLLSADVGLEVCQELLTPLREQARKDGLTFDALQAYLVEAVEHLLEGAARTLPRPQPDTGPQVLMFVGVNGSGKTTTVAKVGRALADEGQRVLLAAADTFRTAAIEQLTHLAERAGLDLIAQKPGADPGAVAHDAVEHGRTRGYDAILIDTAGRLQTKRPLMEELGKVRRVVERLQGRPPDERLLVVDASAGQNAVSQAHLFDQAVGVTGLAITKLDGTAKGGAILPIWRQLRIPILWVGVGEGLEDIETFRVTAFAQALVGREG